MSTLTRVRLEDVAREAGVSKSIASRILNDAPDLVVRPETRLRVIEVARNLRYQPHAAARGLRRAQTGVLGLLIPNLTMPVHALIVRGAVGRARELGFAVLLIEDEAPSASAEDSVPLVRAGRIDGLVIASARPRHPLMHLLDEESAPHVFANRAVRGSRRNVTMDDRCASIAALDELYRLGHRRVGLVAGPRGDDPAKRRAEGFERRARELGLEKAPLVEGDFTEAGGAELACALLEEHPDLTAITTGGISQAIGALHAAWQLGRSVPYDLSVISFDDLPLAESLRPPLTTVRMPLAELGATAVDALVDQLDGCEPRDIVVATRARVIRRLSTAPAPS